MFRNNETDAAVRAAESDRKQRAKLHDKQSERDYRDLRIDKVGVRGMRFPIQVRDKARSLQNTIATIGMYVDLPKEFKGTHMSRFIEVLHAHGSVVHVEIFSRQKSARVGPGKRDGLHGPLRCNRSREGNRLRPDRADASDDAVPVLEGDRQTWGA